jgi:hypothetical protein
MGRGELLENLPGIHQECRMRAFGGYAGSRRYYRHVEGKNDEDQTYGAQNEGGLRRDCCA